MKTERHQEDRGRNKRERRRSTRHQGKRDEDKHTRNRNRQKRKQKQKRKWENRRTPSRRRSRQRRKRSSEKNGTKNKFGWQQGNTAVSLHLPSAANTNKLFLYQASHKTQLLSRSTNKKEIQYLQRVNNKKIQLASNTEITHD